MDELRGKIAAAMNAHAEQHQDWMFADLADAVVAALDMYPERLGEVMGHPHPAHRYVTPVVRR